MTNKPIINPDQSAEEVWEGIYRRTSPSSSGKPGFALERFAESLAPGAALELGCAKGDDAVWLASRGWRVVAVDISSTALAYAKDNARRQGVESQVAFEQYDLAQSFPNGSFDLVTASFLHSPVDWPRAEVLRKAADAVAWGGHLLIVEHGSRAPWSWADPDVTYPSAKETFDSLELDEMSWSSEFIAAVPRTATGPEGEEAVVVDNVIFLKRGCGLALS